jgi:hypothetical protein
MSRKSDSLLKLLISVIAWSLLTGLSVSPAQLTFNNSLVGVSYEQTLSIDPVAPIVSACPDEITLSKTVVLFQATNSTPKTMQCALIIEGEQGIIIPIHATTTSRESSQASFSAGAVYAKESIVVSIQRINTGNTILTNPITLHLNSFTHTFAQEALAPGQSDVVTITIPSTKLEEITVCYLTCKTVPVHEKGQSVSVYLNPCQNNICVRLYNNDSYEQRIHIFSAQQNSTYSLLPWEEKTLTFQTASVFVFDDSQTLLGTYSKHYPIQTFIIGGILCVLVGLFFFLKKQKEYIFK